MMFGIDKPLATGFDEWDEWHRKAAHEHPIRYFLSESLPIWLARTWRTYIHDPWYWLKCRVWHQYNVVVCRDLPPTWVDRDHLLLHASFQILKDFVEREDRAYAEYPGHTQKSRDELIKDYHWASDPQHWTAEQIAENLKDAVQRADQWIEVRTLYEWWERRRTSDESPIGYDEELSAFDSDSAMLKRLADIRGHLWT